MKKWDWIFFDADETLFTFDSFTGLQRMFLDYSITFTAEDFQELVSKEQIDAKIHEMAALASEDYRDKNPLLVAVLKGAVNKNVC